MYKVKNSLFLALGVKRLSSNHGWQRPGLRAGALTGVLMLFVVCALFTRPAHALQGASQRAALLAGVEHKLAPHVGGDRFRSPESLETFLAENLAQRLNLPLQTVQTSAASGADLLQARKIDLLMLTVPVSQSGKADASFSPQATLVSTGYDAAPMAIMRTDTRIRRWQDLKGQRVCLSEGGSYVGKMAARYGAVEVVHKAPADSLLALRVGECDAAVHDDTFLQVLLRMPEWKKFSAQLKPELPRHALVVAISTQNQESVQFVRKAEKDWQARRLVTKQLDTLVRNIAFEVYLAQDVPDCH